MDNLNLTDTYNKTQQKTIETTLRKISRKSKNYREVLEYAQAKDKNIAITNGRILIEVKDYIDNPETVNYHPVTKEVTKDLEYPDLENVKPPREPINTLKVDVKMLENALDTFLETKGEFGNLTMIEFDDVNNTVSVNGLVDKISTKGFTINQDNRENHLKAYFDTHKLKLIVMFYRQMKVKEITLNFQDSGLRPIYIENDDKNLYAVLAPMRTPWQ